VLVFCAALAAPQAHAQPDPFRARVRGLTETQYSSFQGAQCVSVEASKDVVWDVLVSSEYVRSWLLAELGDAVPRRTAYRRGREATKDDVLKLDIDTKEGPRSSELTVVVFVPGQLFALEVTKDDQVIAKSTEHLIHTFYLDERGPGETDVWWALHYDADSPLSAVFSTIGKRAYRRRVLAGLQVLKGISEVTEELNRPVK